jgi:hypothetical protein
MMMILLQPYHGMVITVSAMENVDTAVMATEQEIQDDDTAAAVVVETTTTTTTHATLSVTAEQELNHPGEFVVLDTDEHYQDHHHHQDDDANANAAAADSTISHIRHEYDYDMMYRTLSNLPQEEKDRMQLPLTNVLQDSQNSTAHEIRQFQEHMRHIWEQRQAQLRGLEMADLPLILQQRIQSIRDYIASSSSSSSPSLVEDSSHPNHCTADTTNSTDTSSSNSSIVQVLQDLEYHLQDLDMTRDFHTLGGWSVLVSLLDNTVHTLRMNHHAYAAAPYTSSTTCTSSTATTTTISTTNETNARTATTTAATHPSTTAHHGASTTTNMEEDDDVVPMTTTSNEPYHRHTVQMYTAWAMGTAVKHMLEFHPYATEPIRIQYRTSPNTTTGGSSSTLPMVRSTTPIELVMQQIQLSLAELEHEQQQQQQQPTTTTTTRDRQLLVPILRTKLLRLIYCLGSFLRGNFITQQHYVAALMTVTPPNSNSAPGPPTPTTKRMMLSHRLWQLVSLYNNNNHNHDVDPDDYKFLQTWVLRFMNVVADCMVGVVTAMQEHEEHSGGGSSSSSTGSTVSSTSMDQLQMIWNGWRTEWCTTTTTTTSIDSHHNTMDHRVHSVATTTLLDYIQQHSEQLSPTFVSDIHSTMDIISSLCTHHVPMQQQQQQEEEQTTFLL